MGGRLRHMTLVWAKNALSSIHPMRSYYHSPAGRMACWFERHFSECIAFLRRQPAAAPLAWFLGGFLLALLTGKEAILVVGMFIGITVIASRWTAVFLDSLREQPGYRRRRSLKEGSPFVLVAAISIWCARELFGYFGFQWPVDFGVAATVVVARVLDSRRTWGPIA